MRWLCFGFLLFPWFLLALDRLFPLQTKPSDRSFAVVIAANDGMPLRAFADHRGVWRYPVALDDVSPRYLAALIAYEDRYFYYHFGVNPVALLRAVWINGKAGRTIAGGSTLTMQVARILYPHEKSIAGKMRQILRALQLEWHLSKSEILTIYLQYVPFGGRIEGVEAASFAYLHKSSKNLTEAESALLAVLPQSPSRWRPDRFPGRARLARDKVLRRMAKHGLWTRVVVDDALREPVIPYRLQTPFLAPHLAQKLFAENRGTGLIRTTIDSELQQNLEEFAHNQLAHLPPQATLAIVVAEKKDASVRAYIGNADFYDVERAGQVDLAQALRSPGSTLKPFLYGLALDEGLIHSESLLSDAPLRFGSYRPGNFYDGFSGPVSVSEALQRSLNLPAVQVLQALGPNTFFARLKNAGIDLHLPEGAEPGLPMILGGVSLRLTDLVSAFTALGNDGRTMRLRFRSNDAVSDRYLLSSESAYIIRRILSDAPRPSDFVQHHPLLQRQRATIAFKTGTSYGFRDAWAIGVSERYVIGVWVGRADGVPLPGEFGLQTAAPILFGVHQQLHEPLQAEVEQPEKVVEKIICWPLGRAKDQTDPAHCHREKRALTIQGVAPPTLPSLPYDNMSNPLSILVDQKNGGLISEGCAMGSAISKQIALWPKAVEPFLPSGLRRRTLIPRPDKRCAQTAALASGQIEIVGFRDGARLRSQPGQQPLPRISLHAIGGQGNQQWFVDGKFITTTASGGSSLYQFEKLGEHQIVVVDEGGQSARVTIVVEQS